MLTIAIMKHTCEMETNLIVFLQNQYFKAYKQAKRRDDDISIVNAAFFLTLEGKKIKSLAISYGGMAPTTLLATKASLSLVGKWVL